MSEGTWTPSANATPGQGSSASRRLPSRSTWSQSGATTQPAAIAEAGLDHAAEHDAEAERARSVRHPHRLADPARLRELDVDPVRDLGARGDVVEPVAVLVDVDRDRRALLQRPAALVARAQRLLAVGDAELRELRQRIERLLERPELVHVDLERQLGDAADGAHALDVEPVAAAELQLQPLEPRLRPLGAPGHVVRVAEPDRPRGRRAGARQPEQLPDRDAEQLPLQVVERAVERRACGVLAGRQPSLDLLERERVVAEQRRLLLDVGERGGGRLVVTLDRRRLAEAGDAVVAQLDLDDVGLVARLARDHERLGEAQSDDAGGQLHGGYTRALQRP